MTIYEQLKKFKNQLLEQAQSEVVKDCIISIMEDTINYVKNTGILYESYGVVDCFELIAEASKAMSKDEKEFYGKDQEKLLNSLVNYTKDFKDYYNKNIDKVDNKKLSEKFKEYLNPKTKIIDSELREIIRNFKVCRNELVKSIGTLLSSHARKSSKMDTSLNNVLDYKSTAFLTAIEKLSDANWLLSNDTKDLFPSLFNSVKTTVKMTSIQNTYADGSSENVGNISAYIRIESLLSGHFDKVTASHILCALKLSCVNTKYKRVDETDLKNIENIIDKDGISKSICNKIKNILFKFETDKEDKEKHYLVLSDLKKYNLDFPFIWYGKAHNTLKEEQILKLSLDEVKDRIGQILISKNHKLVSGDAELNDDSDDKEETLFDKISSSDMLDNPYDKVEKEYHDNNFIKNFNKKTYIYDEYAETFEQNKYNELEIRKIRDNYYKNIGTKDENEFLVSVIRDRYRVIDADDNLMRFIILFCGKYGEELLETLDGNSYGNVFRKELFDEKSLQKIIDCLNLSYSTEDLKKDLKKKLDEFCTCITMYLEDFKTSLKQ